MDPLNRRKYTIEALAQTRKAHCGSCCGSFIDIPRPTLLSRDEEDELFYFCSMACAEYYIDEFRDDFRNVKKPKKKLEKTRNYWN